MKKIIAIFLASMLAAITLVSCDAPPSTMTDSSDEEVITTTATKYKPINMPKTNYTTPFMSQMSTASIPAQPTTAKNLTPYQRNVSTYEHGNNDGYNIKTEKTTKQKLYNPSGRVLSLKDIYSALTASDFMKKYNKGEKQKCMISYNENQINVSNIKYTYRANPYNPTAASLLTPNTSVRFTVTYNTYSSLIFSVEKQELKSADDILFVNDFSETLFNEVYKLYKYPDKKKFSKAWIGSSKKYSVEENGFTFTTDTSKYGSYINSFEINLISGIYF